jgi:hypothetical protein
MDIDITNGGANQNAVWLRAGTNPNDLTVARDTIAATGNTFTPQAMIVATWYKVEAFNERVGEQNTFQLAMPYSKTEKTCSILSYPQLEFYQSGNGNVAWSTISDSTRSIQRK